MNDNRIEEIARACHELNRAWCEVFGDHTQSRWEDAEEWQRDSARKGVRFAIENPDAPDSTQHDAWMEDKIEQGWVYGTVKDASATPPTHPCLVPYNELPPVQQGKDAIFKTVVCTLLKGVE